MKLPGPESGKSVPPVRASGSSGDASLKKVMPPGNLDPVIKKPILSEGRGVEIPQPRIRQGVEMLRVQSGAGMPRTEIPGRADVLKPGHAETLIQLVRSLNLPVDSLSSALISFARHFSLPLDPALLSKLRREALSSKMPRESAALAAAAAADKGVELTTDALERYVSAIDPDAGREQGGMDSPGGGAGREGARREAAKREPDDPAGDDTGGFSVSGAISAEELKKSCFDTEANDPLLRILNNIPGKNGDRWMVYPFQVLAGGKRLRVSLRVMAGQGKDAARLAVDIAGGDRRWLFVVNRPAGPEAGFSEVRVSFWPPLPRREGEVLEQEIREALGPLVDRVILRDCESFLSDSKNEVLSSVNEEV